MPVPAVNLATTGVKAAGKIAESMVPQVSLQHAASQAKVSGQEFVNLLKLGVHPNSKGSEANVADFLKVIANV